MRNNADSDMVILIIEDDTGLNKFIVRNLKEHNYNAVSAFNGNEAIEFLKTAGNFLLILDYKLPDMSAKDLITLLKKKFNNFPFIIITGFGDEKIAVEMMKMGAYDYVVKDQNFIDILPSVIEKVLKRISIETDLSIAEDLLRKSEERYRLINDNLKDLVCVHNLDTSFKFVSPSVENVLGYKADEIIGRSLKEIAHHDDLSIISNAFDLIIKGSTINTIEARLKTKNNDFIWFEIIINMVKNENGENIEAHSVSRDIDQRKNAEDALLKSEKFNKMIISNVSEGIIVYDLNMNFKVWNKFMENLTGYSEKEMIGNFFPEAFPNFGTEELKAILSHVINGETIEMPDFEYYSSKTNKKTWIWTSFTPNYSFTGEIIGVIGTVQNINERKKAEERIAKINEELEQKVQERTIELTSYACELEAFSYSVSHDLKSPLRSINGFSNALIDDFRSKLDENALDYLLRISDSSKRMSVLIDDLHNLSLITRKDLNIHKFNLSELFKNIALEYINTNKERNIEFKIKNDIFISADKNLVHIALDNLIGNAVKFTSTREKSIIEFGNMTVDGNETLYIKDNGVGFDMAYISKLFLPFQRLHTQNEFPGTGIGLATVQRIIIKHGGFIKAESEVDNGVIFYFSFQQ
jgi:PAS domain S-box-containing protein